VKARCQEIIALGDMAFTKKLPILSLWQSISEQFDPVMASYTYVRSMGMEFASHLMTGAPSMANRDLSNAISAMLRPPGQSWFHCRTQSERINKDTRALVWLDWATEQQRQAMYINTSGWSRASKDGDRSFVTIGNACISLRPNRMLNGILYKAHHMRDVAWSEDEAGQVDTIHVKRKVSNRNLIKLFPKTVPDIVRTNAEKDPDGEVMCRHVVMPSDEYDSKGSKEEVAANGERKKNKRNLPFTSVWIDVDNSVMLEEIGQWQLGYIPPRWDTRAESPYGYSPPSTINISDARMLQQITLTLLEAGQKSVDPPYKAVGEMIEGGINTFAGAVTWVSSDYDERTGPILEPLLGTQPNLGWGVDREKRIMDLIANGHFLNQIKLPDTTHARTAYEVQKLWEEFIRNTTPLFEPIQVEYNGAVCDRTFEMMLRMNAFGSMADMPQILKGQDVMFTFDSPLTTAATRANAQAFTTVLQLTQGAVSLDPSLVNDVNSDEAFRDALAGSGAPATWINDKQKSQKLKDAQRQQQAAQQQTQQAIATAGAAGDAGTKIGNAANLLQQGGILAPPPVQPGGSI
jgi:hypothetical protein